MKKFNAKFIVSALIAASMITASAISASAGEYARHEYQVPTYTGGSGSSSSGSSSGSSSSGSSTTETPKEQTPAGSTAIDPTAFVGKTTIDLPEDSNGDIKISEAIVGAVATTTDVITVNVDAKDGLDYAIEIDPKLITEAKAINLAMDITIPTSDKTVDGVTVPAGSIVIDPAQSGDFGMTLKVKIPVTAFAGMDISKIAVYYIADNGEVTLLTDTLSYNEADGTVSVAISHASAYVITDENLLDEGDIDDDDDDVSIDDDDDTDDTTTTPSKGKDDSTVTVVDGSSDSNPVTGTTLALGSLAVFAAAAAVTSKKRK